MYQYIQNLINHVWQTGSGAPGDQTYIYAICTILTPLCLLILYDLFSRVIYSIFTIFKGGEK